MTRTPDQMQAERAQERSRDLSLLLGVVLALLGAAVIGVYYLALQGGAEPRLAEVALARLPLQIILAKRTPFSPAGPIVALSIPSPSVATNA